MAFEIIQYIAFIVVALIIIWAVIELNKRLIRMRDKDERGRWVRLDVRRLQRHQHADEDEDDPEEEINEIHMHARRNGYHTENTHPPV